VADDINAFKTVLDRIDTIIKDSYGEIAKARNIPAQYASAIADVGITSGSRYGRGASPEAMEIARRAIKEASASERQRGEVECNEKLAALAIEIHSLRAVLPGLAAQASIALGVLAREIAEPQS
jgi:hypothetical protein